MLDDLDTPLEKVLDDEATGQAFPVDAKINTLTSFC